MIIVTLLSASVMISSCASIPGSTKDEKIKNINSLVEQTITELYKLEPETKELIGSSAGYAVMEGITTKWPMIGTGSGYGVAINKQTGEKTYLEITKFDIGAGLGVKSIRFAIIFQDEKKFNKFKSGVWQLGTSMEATAKSKDIGTAVGTSDKKYGEKRGYSVHLITDSGASATATFGIFQSKPINLEN